MKHHPHRLARYLLTSLLLPLLTALSPAQPTGGTIASQAADSTLSNVDPATGREALAVQSTDVVFLERFGRLADASTVEPGDAAEIGGNWRWHHLGDNEYPAISSGALRATDGSVYYLGRPVSEAITSFTVEVEWRPSASYPTGTYNNGFTIGLGPSTMLDADGGEVTLPVNMLHIRTDRTGIAGFEIGNGGVNWDSVTAEGNGSFPIYWGPSNLYTMQFGRKYVIHVEIDTAAHECRVTALGKTWKFVDAQIGATGPYTDFYIEAGGDTVGAATYDSICTVHKVWVNGPQLDQTPGWGVMPYNDALAALSTGSVASPAWAQLRLPGLIDGNVSSSSNTDRLVVGGNTFVNGRLSIFPISGHGRYQVPMVIQTIGNTTPTATKATGGSGAPIVSAALITDESQFQLTDLALPNNGDSISYEIHGYFGSNGNSKRLKIESVTLGNWFDSGALTQNAAGFVLRMTRTKVSGASHMLCGEFETSAGKVILRSSHNFGSSSNSVIRATGTAAGDVTIYSVRAIYWPAGT